jgi:hypothetical protein
MVPSLKPHYVAGGRTGDDKLHRTFRRELCHRARAQNKPYVRRVFFSSLTCFCFLHNLIRSRPHTHPGAKKLCTPQKSSTLALASTHLPILSCPPARRASSLATPRHRPANSPHQPALKLLPKMSSTQDEASVGPAASLDTQSEAAQQERTNQDAAGPSTATDATTDGGSGRDFSSSVGGTATGEPTVSTHRTRGRTRISCGASCCFHQALQNLPGAPLILALPPNPSLLPRFPAHLRAELSPAHVLASSQTNTTPGR